MKLLPELIVIKVQKITCLNVENVTCLDSPNCLVMPLRKLSDAFWLTTEKSWYPHLFNTAENTDYAGPEPDILYYGMDQMRQADKE
jgi:DNA polymerase type B, organellar and viral.